MRSDAKTREYLAWCRSLLAYRTPLTAANALLNVVLFAYSAANTLCMRQILNGFSGAPGGALRAAVPWLIGMAAAALVRVAAIRGCAVLDAKRAYYYQSRTRLCAVNRALACPDAARVSGEANRIFEALDDDVPIATFPAELLTEVGGYCVYALLSLGILLSVHWRLTLFVFVPLSAALYGVGLLSRSLKARRAASREAHDAASAFLGDVTEAALEIRMAGAEEAALRRFDAVFGRRRAANLRDAAFNERVLLYLNGAVYIGTGLMMLAGAKLMAGDAFGLGDFSLFVAHLGTLSNCVERVVELFVAARRAEVSFWRIADAACEGDASALFRPLDAPLNRPDEAEPEPPAGEPFASFEARGLSFSRGGAPVFENVSFSVLPGQLAVIRGGVASGKSTLIGVLTGVLPVQGGAALYNGRPIDASMRPFSVAGAGQGGGLFSASLGENLRLGQRVEEADLRAALDAAAFARVADERGMDAPVGEGGERLSGGQRQRLLLARALSRASGLLIADDCVSALDPETRTAVLAALLAYLRGTGRAAIVATNDAAFLAAADAVVDMGGTGDRVVGSA